MYAIYGNIYHQYTPNVSIYTSTMDPMGYKMLSPSNKNGEQGLFISIAESSPIWQGWEWCWVPLFSPKLGRGWKKRRFKDGVSSWLVVYGRYNYS